MGKNFGWKSLSDKSSNYFIRNMDCLLPANYRMGNLGHKMEDNYHSISNNI